MNTKESEPGKWKLETITPKLAQQYLDTMSKNRKLRPAKVSLIAKDMRCGEFDLTHQGIAFNCDGSLKDGQHRLNAIIESGVTVRIWVYRGLSTKAMLNIDTHSPRNDADGLSLSGTEADNKDVAIAKRMKMGNVQLQREQRSIVKEFLVKYREPINDVKSAFGSHVKGICNAATMAVVARALVNRDRQRTMRFAGILKTGITDNPKEDSAAIRLRDFLIMGGAMATSPIIYRKTEYALSAFLERKPLAKIFEASDELFPIDEDKPK